MCCKREEALDYFDHLPDSLILFIFNKLQDANSLTKCLLVSKRFSSLVPFTNSIFISTTKTNTTSNAISFINTLRLGLHNLFLKPLTCFHQIKSSASKSSNFDANSSYYCHPNYGVLKNFKEIKSLHLQLPSHELGSSTNGASFLKWKAEFGANLKTCIIVGATSFETSSSFWLQQKQGEMEENNNNNITLSDDELKLRVIWTISCLIAASTRHYLLKQILGDDQHHPIFPMLENVVISDANKQGEFCMGKEGIFEMRDSIMKSSEEETSSLALKRSKVPEMKMKLWYLPMVELPVSGYVMRGATLLLIRPVYGDSNSMEGDLHGHGDVFSEAVREMIKVKKSYLMTMSSF